MKLQKLCYYAQGYALAESVRLFDEDFQAWQHGPVIRSLYDKYRGYQWRQISEEVGESDKDLNDFLHQVVSAYGRFDGAALSTMTHRENPWINARMGIDESAGSTATITKDSISQYFTQKLTEMHEQDEKQ